jgi:MFS family permease
MAPNENFLSFSNCTITFYNQICWAMLAFLYCGKSQDNPIMNQTHAPSSTSSTQGFNKVVIVTSLAFVVAQLDVSIVNIALPDIASTFGADIHVLQWIIDAYTLAFAALLLSAGNLADLLGAKAVFQSGMLIFGLASIACGFSPTGEVLTSFRALQGLGAAVMIPSSLAILNQSFAHIPTMRVKAVALWTAAGSAAIAAGPIVGGIIIHLSNWRYIFFVNAPICAIGIFLTSSLKLEKTPARSVKFDVWGQLCWMLSITVLISAVIELPKRGLESPYIYGALILSAISFNVFLLIERKVPSPMLPLGLFRSASFNSLLVLGAVLNGFYYGSVFLISLCRPCFFTFNSRICNFKSVKRQHHQPLWHPPPNFNWIDDLRSGLCIAIYSRVKYTLLATIFTFPAHFTWNGTCRSIDDYRHPLQYQ